MAIVSRLSFARTSDVLHGVVGALDGDRLAVVVRADESLVVRRVDGDAVVAEVAHGVDGALVAVPQVAQHAAHVPLRLGQLRPRRVRERELADQLGGAPVLALAEARLRRILLQHGPLRRDLRVADLGRELVAVVDVGRSTRGRCRRGKGPADGRPGCSCG